jgi:hypothetical protein
MEAFEEALATGTQKAGASKVAHGIIVAAIDSSGTIRIIYIHIVHRRLLIKLQANISTKTQRDILPFSQAHRLSNSIMHLSWLPARR